MAATVVGGACSTKDSGGAGGAGGVAAGGGQVASSSSSASTSSGADAGDDAAMSGGCDPSTPLGAVVAAMAPGTWHELPNTLMKDICPQPYDHYLCEYVFSNWDGGVYDSKRDQLIVWGGGHAGGYYNNLFGFDLINLKWARINEPIAFRDFLADATLQSCALYPKDGVTSYVVPPAMAPKPGESVNYKYCDDPAIAGQLDDQQPRVTHSYGNIAYSPVTDRMYVLGSAALYIASGGSPRVEGFDLVGKKWIRGADNTDASFGVSATDEKGHIWFLGQQHLQEYDPTTDVWTQKSAPAAGAYYAGAAVDRKRHILSAIRIGNDAGDVLEVHSYALPSPSTNVAQMIKLPRAVSGAPGVEYSPALDRYVVYSTERTTPPAMGENREVYLLNPETWELTVVPAAGDDPGPAQIEGTFGRFRYNERCDVFVIAHSSERNVFLFKPPAAP
jgi:hypothetical protein